MTGGVNCPTCGQFMRRANDPADPMAWLTFECPAECSSSAHIPRWAYDGREQPDEWDEIESIRDLAESFATDESEESDAGGEPA